MSDTLTASDLQTIVDNGIHNIQNSIDQLNTLKLQPDADILSLDNAITELQCAQVSLQDMFFTQTEDDPVTGNAVAKINTAGTALKDEIGNIADMTKIVTKVTSYVGYAADFVSALHAVMG